MKKKQAKPIEKIVQIVVSAMDKTIDRIARQSIVIGEYERVMEHLLIILTFDEKRKLLKINDDLCPGGGFVVEKVEQLLAERRKQDGNTQEG